MRRLRRIFSMYSIDLWIFIIIIAVLTALIHYSYSGTSAHEEGSQEVLLYVFSCAALICVFIIQVNTKWKISLLSELSVRACEKFSSKYTHIELTSYQTSVLTLAALSFVFVIYIVNAVLIGRQTVVLAALLLALFIILLSFYLSVIKGMSDRSRYILIGFCMLLPIAIALIADDLGIGFTPNAYVWLVAAITFSMLLNSRKASKLLFKLFTCTLYIGMLISLRYSPDIDFMEMVGSVSNIFFAGFVIFAPLDFRMERSQESFYALESINRELQETQTQLIQREQMVTLGQLIAGVAHEINTPIGAIKASAEMLDSLNYDKVLRDMRRFDDEAMEVLICILAMCVRSTKNMRSTIDIRRGKALVRKFMESIDVEKPAEICAILAEMEICDVEKIETNMDLFRRGDIMDILTSARSLKPYISSIQSINYASNGIAKIIFALKSFSHMNTTGERQQFDIVRNIDNVLVLYHNQIKRGIEVVKLYDDNLPQINGNVEELSQVWTNIIQNAIYAMSYVGQLTITIRSISDKKVVISFSDTGTGISPENIDKLFEPFYTTKPLGEGSGLGLDICKKVVEKHNGEIEVSSKPGHGAVFTVTLPAHEHSALTPFAQEVKTI